jgi:hypothetical protein
MLRGLIVAIAMLAATSAQANALTPEDQQRFGSLVQKAFTFSDDLNAAGRAAFAAGGITPLETTCLLSLRGNAALFFSTMNSLYVLVAIDVAVIDRRDEAAVLGYLQKEIRASPSVFGALRHETNAGLGHVCVEWGSCGERSGVPAPARRRQFVDPGDKQKARSLTACVAPPPRMNA